MHIINLFRNKNRENIFELGDKKLERLKKENRYSCYRNTRATLRKFSLFLKGKQIAANHVTPEMIRQFQKFLEEQMGNGHNTVVENLKILSELFDEAGLQNNPCKDITLSREPSRRNYLLEEELQRIMALRLPDRSEIAASRDIFFVECRTGLRISDLLQLRWQDYRDSFLFIRMQKTQREIEVPVSASVAHVLASYRDVFTKETDYIFPWLREARRETDAFSASRALVYSTARVNLQLKKLAARAGIGKTLSTHVGRHTFATTLLSKGASIYEIKELLGHQDVKVTQVYAHLLAQRKQELVNLLE